MSLEYSGLIIGAWVFVIIMFARKLCIWGEYHFGTKFWIFFLVAGLLFLVVASVVENKIVSVMLSSAGFIFLWGIHETIEQTERVKKGWYPRNPKRK